MPLLTEVRVSLTSMAALARTVLRARFNPLSQLANPGHFDRLAAFGSLRKAGAVANVLLVPTQISDSAHNRGGGDRTWQ